MSSFFADTTAYVAHLPETVTALLATSRPILNSSIVPVVFGTDDLWTQLTSRPFCDVKENNFLKLFSEFSDTMQFTKKFSFSDDGDPDIASTALKSLIETKRYFTRTVQHVTFPNREMLHLCCGKLLNVCSIDLSFINPLADSEIEKICQSFPLLEKLDLSVTGGYSLDGVRSATKLKRLEELKCYIEEGDVLPSFLKELENVKTLDMLNGFFFAENISPAAFDFDDDDSSSSNEPVLFSITRLVLVDCSTFTAHTFRQIAFHAPNLASLCLYETVSPECYEEICKMSSLRELEIENAEYLTSECICSLANYRNESTLQHIRVSSRDGLDPARIQQLAQYDLPVCDLEGYDDGNFTDDAFCSLSEMKFLEKLKISQRSFSDCTGDIGPDRHFPTSLTNLSLDFQGLTDKGLCSIVKSLSLRYLKLDGSVKITSEGLRVALLESSHCKETLEELKIDTPSSKLHDLSFLEGLTALRKLDLYLKKFNFQQALRDPTLKSRSRKGFECLSSSIHLEEVNLGYCKVEDDDIAALASNTGVVNSLRKLNLIACPMLTSKSLRESIPKFEFLVELDVVGWNEGDEGNDSDEDENCWDDEGSRRPEPVCRYTMEDVQFVVSKLGRLKRMNINYDLFEKIENDPRLMKKLGGLMNV